MFRLSEFVIHYGCHTKLKAKSKIDSSIGTVPYLPHQLKTGFLQYNDKSVLQAKYVMFEIGELRNRIYSS